MKCLLVDDEPGIREGLAALLRRKGHEIRTADDCASAAAAIEAETFDVVVTDWRLPDGNASRFVVDCPWPVVAVSGHPEEVEQHAAVRTVLQKPVSPSRLLAAIEAARETSTDEVTTAPLPSDVRRVLDAAQSAVPAGTVARVEDDGTFVVWSAELADDGPIAALRELGGDLRVRRSPTTVRVELRLCRDGRPDSAIPIVTLARPWPSRGEIAVDLDGIEVSPAQFEAGLERARVRRLAGDPVWFLNIPASLQAAASDWEKANDMPMRAPVGPRLPALLEGLWSQS